MNGKLEDENLTRIGLRQLVLHVPLMWWFPGNLSRSSCEWSLAELI
jgi:hypothetical protein